MSLGIAFKGPEGIVLAADSRVTLNAQRRQGKETLLLPSTFDNATKLLHTSKQRFIGSVTFGLGALGQREFRTAHSFLPEFERALPEERITVQDFARQLSDFFITQWREQGMPAAADYQGEQLYFLIGGYDPDGIYGRLFEVAIPHNPAPNELQHGVFGLNWGGQKEFTTRLLNGFDDGVTHAIQQKNGLTDEQRSELEAFLRQNFSTQIPYQFLPLQDCVDLATFLIRTTIELQQWVVGIRGVGGAIDVATVTRTKGLIHVQQKKLVAEHL